MARPNRTEYLVAWAYQKRVALIKELGGKCSICSTKKRLEFDHPKGRNWEPNKKSRWQRIILYTRDALRGNLRLLCRSCNAKTGRSKQWQHRIIRQDNPGE